MRPQEAKKKFVSQWKKPYRKVLKDNFEMGRHYLSHMGGFRLFCCVHCETFLTNRGELISTRFTGATGRAFLFNKVVNLNYRYEIKNISISFGFMLS